MKINLQFNLAKFKCKAFFAFISFIFLSQFTNGQITPFNRGRGALSITPSEYSALLDPNWTEIRSYSTNMQTMEGSSTGPAIVMLNNPPIGDQQSQGSCVGWAVGYAAMGVLTYSKFNCWDVARRSPNYVYNQVKVNSSCGSGAYPIHAINLVKNQGVSSLTLMPYNDAECASMPNLVQQTDASTNRAINYAKLVVNDIASIKQTLSLGFPVIVVHSVY